MKNNKELANLLYIIAGIVSIGCIGLIGGCLVVIVVMAGFYL